MAESENSSESKVNSESVKVKSELNQHDLKRESLDEDDIPDNFFDDFSNNEFMDGLNVLDSWDENQTQKFKAEEQENTSEKDQGPNEEVKDDGKTSEVEKNQQDKSDHGRYNKSNTEKDEIRHKRDYSPRRSPYRRGRSPIGRRGRNHNSRSRSRSRRYSISSRRRRSRSRPTNSPRRGRYCYSPPRSRDYSPRYRRRDYSPYRSRHSIERDRHRRRTPHRSFEKPEELQRRDPAKTKLDIEKDKDKCLRYKEAKEVEKKIIVAESGLCPPGMEDMMDEINNSSFKSMERDPLTLTFRNEKSEKISTECDHGKLSSNSREIDPLTLSFSPVHRNSMEHNRTDRFRDSRDLRDIIRERLANKDHSPSYEKGRFSPDNRSRSHHSPMKSRYDTLNYRSGRRELSPLSNNSDRDVWLRDRSEHREYDRPEKRRKRSPFLHELARTLCNKENKNFDPTPNKSTFNPFNSESVSYNPSQTMSQYGPPQMFDQTQLSMLQHPMDHPSLNMPPMNNGNFPYQSDVPSSFVQQQFVIPQQTFQQFQTSGPYDSVPPPEAQQFQSFQPVPHPFQQFADVSSNQAQIGPNGGPLPQIYNADIQGNATKEILSPSAQNSQKANRNWSNLKDISSKNQQQLSKLFEDKKISLSDFLTVSAKGETVPCNIQEKIKVISRCQDAIKALDTTKKSGRFFPTITPASANEQQDSKGLGKWKSPLKKIAIVKFSFTTPSKGKENEVQTSMKKLLTSINLREQMITPPPPRILKSASTSEFISSKTLSPEKTTVAVQDMFMQTDPYVCQVCDLRNARKFKDVATLTTNFGLDEATQVSPSDLPAPQPTRGILKNSNYPSLSHLTAAQLCEQDQLRNQNNIQNPSGPYPLSSSMTRPSCDAPLDNNLEFNQPLMKMRPQSLLEGPHQDNSDPQFLSFNNSSSQIPNNPWPSWKDSKSNSNANQNLSWKQNPMPSPAWKSMMGGDHIPPPPKLNFPWSPTMKPPSNKRNNNNRGGFKRKPNNVDLTK